MEFGQEIVPFSSLSRTEQKEVAEKGKGVEVRQGRGVVLPVRCSLRVFKKLVWTMEVLDRHEWAGFFDFTTTNNYFVLRSFHFPPQAGEKTRVGFINPQESRNERALVHSHPNGPYYFSDTDRLHVNSNFDVSVLVAGTGQYMHLFANIRPFVSEETIYHASTRLTTTRLYDDYPEKREWTELVKKRHHVRPATEAQNPAIEEGVQA